MSVKASNRFRVAQRALLRWRTRRDGRRLNAHREKLRQALLEVERMKFAITDWAEKNK
jgi:hypothetical protein